MLHVSFIIFWKYLCLAENFILIYPEEQHVLVRVIHIVFILGLITKFLLNGGIKFGLFSLYFWAVELCLGE